MDVSHDRLSDLPDPILSHILSLMPAKAATMTSVLSWRWRGLCENFWSFATTLDFNAEFATRQTPDEFVGAVNRYMKLHRARKIKCLLVSFDLGPCFFSDIAKWVEFAATKDVEELRLDLSCDHHEGYPESWMGEFTTPQGYPENWAGKFRTPHHLFDCVSLRMLSLSNCGFSPSPDFSRLRSLMSLSLHRVVITDDMLRSVLSGCRLLESLILRDCVNFNSLKLASPHIRLKHLALVDCWELCYLQISVASLRSFHYAGEISFDHSFGNISGLVDALVCFINRKTAVPLPDYIKMLSDIAHVEILTVCTATLMGVTLFWEARPQHDPVLLPNLRELQLLMDVMNLKYLSYICGFFRHCPSPLLERLFVRLPDCIDYFFETAPAIKVSLDVHFNQLKMIKMRNFNGSRSEMELVRLLLEKAPVLESLVLVAAPKSSPREGIVVKETGSSRGLKFIEEIVVKETGSSRGLKFIEEMDTGILQGQLLEEMDTGILQAQLLALPRVSSTVHIVVCEYLEDDINIRPTHTELYII